MITRPLEATTASQAVDMRTEEHTCVLRKSEATQPAIRPHFLYLYLATLFPAAATSQRRAFIPVDMSEPADETVNSAGLHSWDQQVIQKIQVESRADRGGNLERAGTRDPKDKPIKQCQRR